MPLTIYLKSFKVLTISRGAVLDSLAGFEGVRRRFELVGTANGIDEANGDAFSLFAATAAEPLADDAPAHAMQLVTILREYRGCAHLVAIRAVGLDTKTAHFFTRPNDGAMFGWAPEDAPVIDDAVREKMARVEALTDDLAIIDDPQERLGAVVDRAKKLPPLAESERRGGFRIFRQAVAGHARQASRGGIKHIKPRHAAEIGRAHV